MLARAVARLEGSSAAYAGVSGFVTFEQAAPLGDVTVRIAASGLRPGLHGFHVHQYGDVRDVSSFGSMGYHFVPFCVPPETVIDSSTGAVLQNATGGCENDQVHGLPPSVRRQPGDMGNLRIGADGQPAASSITLRIGQGKMSLTDKLRSIVGRTLVVHQQTDDGSQPYGNAGGPEAFGVIGLSSPGVAAPSAKAPEIPHVTKLMCSFHAPPGSTAVTVDGVPAGSHSIAGSTLLTLLEPHRPGTVRLQVRACMLHELIA